MALVFKGYINEIGRVGNRVEYNYMDFIEELRARIRNDQQGILIH